MNIRRLAKLSLFPLLILFITMWLRPLWRDEYWALYFSDPSLSLGELSTERLKYDVHPPFYFGLLHFWRMVSDSVIWMKLLNLLFLFIGTMSVFKLGKPHQKQTQLFLLMCAGSYWVIFFAAEVRPYTLLFVTSALSVFITHQALTEKGNIWKLALWWGLVGFVLGFSQYYGALWIGLCGGLTSLVFLARKEVKKFFIWGAVSVLCLIPTAWWIFAHLDTMNLTAHLTDPVDNFKYGFNQFRRGITDKTIGSNLGFFLVAALSFPLLWRQRQAIDRVLLLSTALLIAIIFVLHTSVQPMIKERAFIVVIPSLLFVMSRAIVAGESKSGKWITFWRKTVPVLIILMPILFIGEFTKDREKLGDVRALIASYPECKNQAIVTFFRKSPQGNDFAPMFTQKALKSLGESRPRILNVETFIGTGTPIPETACPIKGMALGLPRGDKLDHQLAKDDFLAVGFSFENLEIVRLAKGRHLFFVDRQLKASQE